ncbi:hypothetical protein V2J09_005764 [Rumex salicifolius]
MADIKLSVSDLPMLSCNYIQKGNLFLSPSVKGGLLLSHLKSALSDALSQFPPLAGRLVTDGYSGEIFISCNDAGAEFVHAEARSVFVRDVLGDRVPETVKEFFSFDGEVSYAGHRLPLLAVQVTSLADGVFIACSVNHAVADGTSFWNFFTTFADLSKGATSVKSKSRPDFSRKSVLISDSAVLRVPAGGPTVTFAADQPVRERIFSFSRAALLSLKAKANNYPDVDEFSEIAAKHRNDAVHFKQAAKTNEISSFQSLCALLWRCVTRARRLSPTKTTTFRMAANCRHRLEPKLDPLYFGNAIQSVATTAAAGEVVASEIRWSAELLRRSVKAHDDGMVRKRIGEWEAEPKCFPLGNFDGAMMTMGSSPWFPMYEGDFGWGKPVSVRSGRANKFDGKMSAFPGRRGGGSVDVEFWSSNLFLPRTMNLL